MTVKEAERLGVMKELERKKLTYQEASEVLNLSRRQTIRMMKRYRREGAKGVISQKKGAASPRRYSLEKKIKSIALVKERYEDFGPSFASEKLKKDHAMETQKTERKKSPCPEDKEIKSGRADPNRWVLSCMVRRKRRQMLFISFYR